MPTNLLITRAHPGDDEDEVFERIVSSIKECAAYAEQKKVLIGLHNHNHGQIPATGEMVVKLLEAVDSPNFVGLLDSGQWYGSPGIGAGSMAYGKPDGYHGTPLCERDPEYDYLDSIKTAANSGKLVQVSVVYMTIPSSDALTEDTVFLVCPVQVRAKIYRISSGEEKWLDYDKILPILKVSSPQVLHHRFRAALETNSGLVCTS